MAQQDTGLGWSAKDNWLLSAPLKLCEITGEPDPSEFYPVGFIPTGVTVNFGNVRSYGTIWGTNGSLTYYIATDAEDVYMCKVNSGTPYVHLLSKYPFTAYYSRSDYSASGVPVRTQAPVASYNSTYDLYYIALSNGAFTNPTLPSYMPIYNYTTDAYQAFNNATTVSYYKLNSGYAVACVAKWVNIDGDIGFSPILISTNPDYTLITINGTVPVQPQSTFTYQYEGVTFYMSLIPALIEGETSYTPSVILANLTQFAAATPLKVFRLIANASFANIKVLDTPDPYENEGSESEEGGGNGTDPEDDPVEEQTNPLPSVAGLGFCTVYVPSQSELIAMSSYLWSGNFDVSQVIKLFSNPLDSILGLSAVPIDLVGTQEQIYLGGVALPGVTMPRYTGRTAIKVDMGTVTIDERYGSYLDYDPYTEFAIYIPFIGIKNLKADDIMGKTVSLIYDIDILTGACVAYLRPVGGSVLYEWAGQCAQQIPVTSSNWDNIFRNAITAATTLGVSLISPPSAPVLAGAVASASVQAVAAKPRIERSGSLSGVSGWLGQLRPYIIRTIPEAYIPADQNKYIGYPAYINVSMDSIVGYNEVASVHLEGIPATGNELAEIESLLKGGVIF